MSDYLQVTRNDWKYECSGCGGALVSLTSAAVQTTQSKKVECKLEFFFCFFCCFFVFLACSCLRTEGIPKKRRGHLPDSSEGLWFHNISQNKRVVYILVWKSVCPQLISLSEYAWALFLFSKLFGFHSAQQERHNNNSNCSGSNVTRINTACRDC